MPLHKNNSQYREEATMSKKATTTAEANSYQIVTESIVASLRAGIIPWEKPWQALRFSGRPSSRRLR
jgi:antirestriction protein ArdC